MVTPAHSSPFPTSDANGSSESATSIPSSYGESSPSPNLGETVEAAADKAEAAAAAAPALLDRVVKGAHATIDLLAEKAAPHVERLQGGVAGANDLLHNKAGEVRDLSDEWAESLRATVREKPIAALATALAVGLLVSRLTR